MGWLPDNSLKCDTCENVLLSYRSSRKDMESTAIAARWGMYAGHTNGGQEFLTISCRHCREGSHRRVIKKITGPQQDDLWGQTHDQGRVPGTDHRGSIIDR